MLASRSYQRSDQSSGLWGERPCDEPNDTAMVTTSGVIRKDDGRGRDDPDVKYRVQAFEIRRAAPRRPAPVSSPRRCRTSEPRKRDDGRRRARALVTHHQSGTITSGPGSTEAVSAADRRWGSGARG